jgi:dimethylglycine dehydrogenase
VQTNHYRAVVIGGGVVGASVLYHLAKLGWEDLLLVERSELTAGSTWHAAAGFHTLNGDPNVAALQKYTIDLYPELEAETGLSCGLHLTGGINLAGTPERWEWLQSQWAVFQTIGNETVRLIGPEEIEQLCPIVDVSGIHGGMYDTYEGHLDPSGTTHAYAAAARKRGAEVVLHNRVLELHQRRDGWTVVTEHGTITAEHVVNAGGLWARNVGRMAGVDLPVTPMEHHYLVTEAIPEVAEHDGELPMMMDLEGFTYLRQEAQGLLLGVYELNPKHWHVGGAPWDFGMRLLPPDVERIGPELEIGLSRFPCLETAGIKTWVNGAFTFTPDGNPLVGPVPGRPGFWSACGVMAGFSQGGGVGLALAQWMVHGEPESDVFGMDVARFGPFASADGYLTATTRPVLPAPLRHDLPQRAPAGGPSPEDQRPPRPAGRRGRALRLQLGPGDPSLLRARGPGLHRDADATPQQRLRGRRWRGAHHQAGRRTPRHHRVLALRGVRSRCARLVGPAPGRGRAPSRAHPLDPDAQRVGPVDRRPDDDVLVTRGVLGDGLLLPQGVAPAVVP